jgi:ribosomal protein L37AE/L43A
MPTGPGRGRKGRFAEWQHGIRIRRRPRGNEPTMAAAAEPILCPRCGRRPRVLELTATTITCADCDPAFALVRRGVRPAFGVGCDVDGEEEE